MNYVHISIYKNEFNSTNVNQRANIEKTVVSDLESRTGTPCGFPCVVSVMGNHMIECSLALPGLRHGATARGQPGNAFKSGATTMGAPTGVIPNYRA